MAKFNFRLDSYLNVKEKVEAQKKNEYGQALARLETERQKLRELVEQQEEQILNFRKSLETSIRPIEIKRYNNRIEIIKIWIAEQEQRIFAAEDYAEKKRLELVEAMKERKMLDTVREKSYEEYVIEEQRAEQRTIDELVSYKASVKV